MIAPFKVSVPHSVKEELLKTLFSGFIGQGEKVRLFEEEFSRHFGMKNVVTVNSGTAAIRLALALSGVGPGDEVISTPYTMVATNTAILEQFAIPVFADIQSDTINLDPEDIEHRITERTKAIMCVHWGGYPCDMDEIHKIATDHDLIVIEDAAHALGATYRGKPIGTISDYSTFSFQAIKHLTTGDGGLLAVRDDDKYDEAVRRRWFGIDRDGRRNTFIEDPVIDITEPGYKYHMNDIAATIGLEQLKYFGPLFQRRQEIAEYYTDELEGLDGISLLERGQDRTHANWMFAIHTEDRNALMKYLREKKIGVTIHNWRNDRYSVFGGLRKDLPVLARVNEILVNIPMHHDLTSSEIEYIVDEIRTYFR